MRQCARRSIETSEQTKLQLRLATAATTHQSQIQRQSVETSTSPILALEDQAMQRKAADTTPNNGPTHSTEKIIVFASVNGHAQAMVQTKVGSAQLRRKNPG